MVVNVRRDAHLLALDLLETGIGAGSFAGVDEQVRPDLEVLSRAQLVAVASALVAESVYALTPASGRERLRRRAGERHLELMVAD